MRATRSIGLRMGLLVLALSLFSFPACGGKRRPPPVPGGPPAKAEAKKPRKKIKRAKSPRPERRPVEERPPEASDIFEAGVPAVRLLLREKFSRVTIEGSHLGEIVTARAEGNRIHVLSGDQEMSSSGFRLRPQGRRLLRFEGIYYPGVLDVFINPLGVPVVVNESTVEEYVKGVVPHELNPSAFPEPEAIKAQATASRTYAISRLGQFAKRGFDLYSDERSQVYRGKEREHPVANEAVEGTRGMVVEYDSRPINALYFSTCGGKTEAYEFVFSHVSIPYLKGGVECPEGNGKYSHWQETVPVRRIATNLLPWGNIGRIRNVTPLRRGRSERVVELLVRGEKGEKVLKGGDVRSVLGLKSSLIEDFDPRYDSDGYLVEIRVKGRGWGHGVGLCQAGAVELARRGYSYQKILRHYYSDTRLARRY
ncbi:MAG: SpoIID/LytB domain-containing protein [Acidobacteria bacterium]|nr:SpoIID/LytB domain-containing protein [Acidobacteriota bacterium]